MPKVVPKEVSDAVLESGRWWTWESLAVVPGPVRRECIEHLTGKGRKRDVFRVAGAGEDGRPLIAKRCRPATAAIERPMYERVLPLLPLTVPRYYGTLDGDDGFAWVFLEDVGDERFEPDDPLHRTLAAQWLGALHAGAVGLDIDLEAMLPARGAAWYLDHLRTARGLLIEYLGSDGIDPDDAATIESIVGQFNDFEADWARIEAVCAGVPPTLVHGDIQGKNGRFRAEDGRAVLYFLDWEESGWGPPLADLVPARPSQEHLIDLGVYGAIVQRPVAALEELTRTARVLRLVAAVHWAARSFRPTGNEKTMATLHVYDRGLQKWCAPG